MRSALPFFGIFFGPSGQTKNPKSGSAEGRAMIFRIVFLPFFTLFFRQAARKTIRKSGNATRAVGASNFGFMSGPRLEMNPKIGRAEDGRPQF